MRISTIRDTVVCPVCQLSQFEPGNGKCRRCHHCLGNTYIDLFLSNPLAASLTSPYATAVQTEVGGLIRRLRTRRGLTQTQLASLTGIHRTYLSRTERGRVMPSVITLMQIAHALGIDRVQLRLRTPPTES